MSTTNMVSEQVASAYRASGWWSDETIVDALTRNAADRPDGAAYLTQAHPTPGQAEGHEAGELTSERVTWSQVDSSSTRLAAALVAIGVVPGDRVAVWLGDGALVHIAFLAVEKAGATIVGVGARSGGRELAHLLGSTKASVLLTTTTRAGQDTAAVVAGLRDQGISLRHLTVDGPVDHAELALDGTALDPGPADLAALAQRRMGPDDLFLINSTSGTTGLPKCVLHTENRWRYFHQQAAANGRLTADDVFLSAVPAPFGFGLWTSHVTPILLGAPTVLLERFSPEAAFAAIERERVTVLCCVSTQFIMMLASPALADHDLSSLRVMFTGGEAVPYERAREFERLTGIAILQFYGSNETGLVCGTTLDDTPERRLRTAGRIVPEMQVRLFDGDVDVTSTGRGQPGAKGPATCIGYLDDEAANQQLFTEDGWMLMGDIVEIDAEGYLTVVGRTSDIIIRGGKNISAPQVEADIATHPAVAHVAAVAMPDAVFGERVCVYVELGDGVESLTLADLVSHLEALGASKELYPERLIVLDELPRSSGAKVAKGELRADIRRRVAIETATAEATATDAAAPPTSAVDAPAVDAPAIDASTNVPMDASGATALRDTTR